MIGSNWWTIDCEVSDERNRDRRRTMLRDLRDRVRSAGGRSSASLSGRLPISGWPMPSTGSHVAPIGCDTVLDFDEGGDYVLFVETKGELDDIRGDCAADTDDRLGGGRTADGHADPCQSGGLRRSRSSPMTGSATTPGIAGVSRSDGDIDTPAITCCVSSRTTMASPSRSDMTRTRQCGRFDALALTALIVGVVFGVILLVGSRRRHADRPAATDEWAPQPRLRPDWPMSPPGFPAPPPTTGTTAVVGPPSGPAVRPTVAPLPTPPSVAPIPGQPGPWGRRRPCRQAAGT